ncbi:MAG: hypothetical protein KC636_12515, partial [Myxococcales bacterium]|nr:hypothetical protein [Myxococcales bacterium]
QITSTYHHATGDLTMGPPMDPGEPNGVFAPLGERVWGVQSHAGRLYYGVWWEHTNTVSAQESNEVWSVAYIDEFGVPDPATAQLEFKLPGINNSNYSNPVADITFTASGSMIVAERTMIGDTQSLAHQSRLYEYVYQNDAWQLSGVNHLVGELANSSAGGVDHDLGDGGRVWATGDALDFYTPDVVYGLQGIPLSGGDITVSVLIDQDGNIVSQAKTAQGDVEVPIPEDALPVPPPK